MKISKIEISDLNIYNLFIIFSIMKINNIHRLYLGDFGISKMVEGSDRMTIIGTPVYIVKYLSSFQIES